MIGDKLYLFAITILLLGGANLGVYGLFNVNLLNMIDNNVTRQRILMILVGVVTVYLIMIQYKRLYLSFLEETVLPTSIFKPFVNPNANVETIIDATGAKMVVYWASKKDVSPDSKPAEAYGDFSNYGVAEVKNNSAILKVACPSEYKVGLIMSKRLPKHLHYRLIYDNGVLSSIKTVNLKCI
jgi:uncharacterized membrane protein YuzA (DUF378 family)